MDLFGSAVQVYYKLYDQYLQLISLKEPIQTFIAATVLHLIVLWVWLANVSVWGLLWAFYLAVSLQDVYFPRASTWIKTSENKVAGILRAKLLPCDQTKNE